MERYHLTRIAPTPSGYLHLGNILSFSVTAALARRVGALILLRIDDLDPDRVSAEYVEDIFESLRWLGIPWDDGPHDIGDFDRDWSQAHRLGRYREALQQLKKAGKVFACDCSRSRIKQIRGDAAYPGTCRNKGISLETPGCSWRMNTAGSGLPESMTDFIVRKKDGFPAYQLTSVVDDLDYGVDLVIRGDDLRPSTVAQQLLAKQLGRAEFRRIRFVHHPLLRDEEMAKLSKSAGAASVRYLRREGVKPTELFQMIAAKFDKLLPTGDWQALGAAMAAEWGFWLEFPQ